MIFVHHLVISNVNTNLFVREVVFALQDVVEIRPEILQHGQGTLFFHDGYKYVGEFKDGKWDGQGTYSVSDGTKYVGEFKNGKNHGQGTLTFPDGIKFVGEFREDKPWNTTGFDKDGNIFGKYVNGVEQ